MSNVVWTGVAQVKNNMTRYGEHVRDARVGIAEYYAPKIEADAKANAPWTDRTANARQTLAGVVIDFDDQTWIVLRHGMPYGIHLETRWQGRYAIIERTLQSYYDPVRQMMRKVFNG